MPSKRGGLHALPVELTEAERKALDELAAREGMRAGPYLRRLIYQQALAVSPPLLTPEIIARRLRPRRSAA